jgi:predicted histidine transporter YuiF (NhaC family)
VAAKVGARYDVGVGRLANRAIAQGTLRKGGFTMTNLMNALPVMIVVWAVLMGLFLALLAYNGTVTRYEESQLFLADQNNEEKQRQNSIVHRVNKMLPFIRATGALAALLAVAIVAIYTWDAWQKIH